MCTFLCLLVLKKYKVTDFFGKEINIDKADYKTILPFHDTTTFNIKKVMIVSVVISIGGNAILLPTKLLFK